MGEIRTGRDLPYMFVEKATGVADTALLDGERIIALQVSRVAVRRRNQTDMFVQPVVGPFGIQTGVSLEVMEF